MSFIEVLSINDKEVLSLVGAGGKTSLLLEIAEELRENRRILVTTTTKIYVPSFEKIDGLFINNFEEVPKVPGAYVYAGGLNDEKKLLPVEVKERSILIKTFDTTLIEADGAIRKLLKGGKEGELVIDENTTITLGVFNIKALGLKICEENIHRVKEFIKVTGAREGEQVKKEHIKKLILHPMGMFKGFLGKRVLFINGMEEEEDWNQANTLTTSLLEEDKYFLSNIIGGSIKNKIFKAM